MARLKQTALSHDMILPNIFVEIPGPHTGGERFILRG